MNESSKKFGRYVFLWSLVLSMVLVAAAIVNYSVDPYGMFDAPRIQGFNKYKPGATSKVRTTKPYQVDVINPRTIIAGNSRPEMGLNPAHGCWPEPSRPVYNLSIPGATVYMASRYIQHAVTDSEIKQVFWGLDFIDFINHKTLSDGHESWPPPAGVFEERLRVNADGKVNNRYFLKKIKDNLTLLFSLDAIKDTAQTILSQSEGQSSTVRRDGFNPANDFAGIMALEGQGLIFKQKNISVADMFHKPGRTLFVNEDKNSLQFESLRKTISAVKKNNAKIILFINPYHSDYLARIKMAGLWEPFSLWKRKLTLLAAELDVPLWDFSGFNVFSLEQPPSIGDKKNVLQWFWEPAHYRRQYGDMMLSQMLERSCHVSPLSAKGVLLDKYNIDKHLRDIDAAMWRYHREYPQALERLEALY